MLKFYAKQLFSFWQLFLTDGLDYDNSTPNSRSSHSSNKSLLSLASAAASSRVRLQATSVILQLFNSSRQFLSIATCRQDSSKLAFVSYSERLGDLLEICFSLLTRSLPTETDPDCHSLKLKVRRLLFIFILLILLFIVPGSNDSEYAI